jgi:site-specific DNA-methyltransferase (adenine-specific)/adenine-specific DNA-methyltransferase
MDESGREINNFESLSMVLIDNDYSRDFIMKDYYFAKDLIAKSKKKANTYKDISDDVRKALKNANIINVPIKNPGKKVLAIYIDIYGNEFKEEFLVGVQ